MDETWFSFLTLTALLIGGQQMMAQKQFTPEELNFGGKSYRQFVPENRYTIWWGDELICAEADQCSVINKKTGEERILFTLDEINEYAVSDCSSRVKNLFSASSPYPRKPLVLLWNGENMRLYNWRTKRTEWCINTTDEGEVAEWDTDPKATSYIEPKSQQLHIRTADDNGTQLMTDGSRGIVYGQSAHRDEFGIYKGMFWAPNGQKLAFYRMDQSMVADYPQVNIFDRIAECESDKYPMAGEASHKVMVLVYDLTMKKTVTLQVGDPTDRYFTNILWSPDSKIIYMFELNRDQNDCRLVSYDAQTGKKIAELYRETRDKYVESQHPITFLPWDNNLFIMQSQCGGYNHLYLYQTSGELAKQLTKGKWVVLGVIGFNTKDKSIVYTSTEKHALQTDTYTINIKTGKRRLLDNGRGYHSPLLSPSGIFIVDKYSEPTVPRNIEIINTANGKRTQYFEAADPWKEYQVPARTCGIIKAADGTTDLYYRMVKPANFDENKRYPLVPYVYGRPHAHNVDARRHYASRSWETYMAQKGYILLILSNRGSECRGRDFERATFRQSGQIEMQDQVKGIGYVKTLPYVDADRAGVHGWSFGGFMTISLMMNYSETFKVGVADGPVIDWKWYEVMYEERYMDTPQADPGGYSKAPLIPQAKNLKGKLQIIQGTNDGTVVAQHCLSFIAECIKQGTQPDFSIYPDESHDMRGHQSVHLHERITRYFKDYLK